MKRVYEVTLTHKKFENDYHKPWILARSADEASRKAKRYIRENKLPHTQTEVSGVKLVGTIEVE